MWIDPDSGKTWEQIIEEVWHGLPPDVRAQYKQEMAATGHTRDMICLEARERFQAGMAAAERDSAHPFRRVADFKAFPYGHDPRVTRKRP